MRKQRKRDAKLIGQCMKGLSVEERVRKRKHNIKKRDAKLIDQYMKGLGFEERLRNHKLGKDCRVDVTNCLKWYYDYQMMKPCRIDLTNCSHLKVKWYRKKIGGILPEIRLPKIVLRKINKKQEQENEPWILDGFLGDSYLNSEHFRLLLQTPTLRSF